METLTLVPGQITFDQIRAAIAGPVTVALDPLCRPGVDAAAAIVQQAIDEKRTVYGINTGFGLLARTHIDDARLRDLQRSLVLSHAVGTGPLLDDATVRLILVLKIASLARGFSGVRNSVIDALIALVNADVLPCIPSQGSVGASGDLAPLAHMSALLIGVGEARVGGAAMAAEAALARAGLAPVVLGPKEGLALLNGTQVSTALALRGLIMAETVAIAAFVAGAMSVDAAAGSDTPFDARIHAVRGHRGQIDAASFYRDLLSGSAIRASHADCDRVQDPYSLRCQPQVMGACLDQLRQVAATLLTEANAVSDNPLVFADTGEVLSGGNFHAEPVAFAADNLALAIAETGALSERRLSLLVDATMSSGLPAFLVRDGGVNSGFMIAQVTAAALASENKSLAHPGSVDSLPTSANQEDHVSMATYAARRTLTMAENTAAIVAIELLSAAQGIDFRAPLKTSGPLADAHRLIRERAAFWDVDRFFAPDLAAIKALVLAGGLNHLLPRLV